MRWVLILGEAALTLAMVFSPFSTSTRVILLEERPFAVQALVSPSRLSGSKLLAETRHSPLLRAFRVPVFGVWPTSIDLIFDWVNDWEAALDVVRHTFLDYPERKLAPLRAMILQEWFAFMDRWGILPKIEVRPSLAKDDDRIAAIAYECYALQKKYAPENFQRRLTPYKEFKFLSQTRTLVVTKRGQVVGAVNYTLDGPRGFSLEKDFKLQVDLLRAQEHHVAAVWSLMIAPQHQKDIRIVRALIKAVKFDLRREGVDAGLFVVHPNHKKVYMKLLQMKVLAESDSTDGLTNAPGILLYGNPQETPNVIPQLPFWVKVQNVLLPWHATMVPIGFAHAQRVSA